jgi:DNA-binding beta-propeller fold protein YncE
VRRWVLIGLLAGCGGGPTDEWPAVAPLPFSNKARFAITDNRSDELSFVDIDGATPTMLGSIPIGDVPVELEGPHHIAASKDGKSIYFNLSNYVPGTGGGPHGAHGTGNVPGSLVRVDSATLLETGEALVDRNPGDVILSADDKLAYVSHYDLLKLGMAGAAASSTVSIVDVSDPAKLSRLSNTVVCPAAHGEALSADGNTLYVTCYTDEIAILDVHDPRAPKLMARVPVGPGASPDGTVYAPYALTVSPTDGAVYVSCNNSGEVRVYDPAMGAFDEARTLALGGVPMFSELTRDGRTLYVPSRADARLHKVDLATGDDQVVELGAGVGELACLNAHVARLSPDEQRLIVVCEGDQTMTPGTAVSLSTTPFALLGYVQLGLFPDGAAYLPPR